MKKLLLTVAVAIGIASASAATFTDFYTVTYEGKTLANGDYVYADHWEAKSGFFPCELLFTPKSTFNEVTFNVKGYCSNPSYETVFGNPLEWGTPSICWEAAGTGNCENGVPPMITNTTLKYNTPILIQFHLGGEVEELDPDNLPPDFDPSTYEPTYTMPQKTSEYLVVATATVDGVSASDTFTVNVVIGVTAAVDEVTVETDAPAVYYDLQGRRVANPAKGQLVIEKKGAKARKVIL